MATNPTLLTMPIAENGQKNTIPATQAAAGDGLLSQSTGFPPETALPLGAGGKAPTREDMNGALNLLSDIAFYSQKGWTFQYDANQAYYKGCIVMDATDGKRYECINDVAAGTILPSADSNNDYWREYTPGGVPLGTILPYSANAAEPPYSFLFCEGQAISRTMYPDLFALIGTTYGAGDGSTTFNIPNLIEAALLNGSYTKTAYTTAGSATFTAPKTGFYKITVKGGGGGGSGSKHTSASTEGGSGGGEGGTTIGWEHLIAGDIATIVVGAGGVGGAAGSAGGDGGNSTVTINGTTYTGEKGKGSPSYEYAGAGGSGTIPGAPGNPSSPYAAGTGGFAGGSGGGQGGGVSISGGVPAAAINGGGGAGARIQGSTEYAGGAGGAGFATIEYIGISMQYILKAYDAPTPSSAQIDLSQYASDLAKRLTREQTPAFNKRDVVTVSGTYTAPVTGWYRITVKGGGGGGHGGSANTSTEARGGFGGGEGGTSIGFEKMTAGDSVSVVVGAGGAGGAASITSINNITGSDGGNSTVTINGHTYTGGGGKGSGYANGGAGTIPGASGGAGEGYHHTANRVSYGGVGGGVGGGTLGTESFNSTQNGTNGGGGGGGGANPSTSPSAAAGGAGGAGYAAFEYFDPSLM